MFAHLRPFWWAYLACSIVAAMVVTSVVLDKRDVSDVRLTITVAAFAVAVLVQCVSVFVLYRRPGRLAPRGERSVRGSVIAGLVLFGVIFNRHVAPWLIFGTCGLAPVAWFFMLPVGLLTSTYRDVMTD